jgi:hypothetical protein
MKSIVLTFIASLACACASSHTPAPVAADSPPPTDMELTLQDKLDKDHQLTEQETIVNDERLYRASLVDIDNRFNDEKLQMEMCGSVYGARSTQCYALLKHLCEVSMIIDTHSGHHKKLYCDQSVLDYVNPNAKHRDP